MNIYKPFTRTDHPLELRQLASSLAEYLLPGAVPLSPPLDFDPIHLTLRYRETLIQFVLFARELGEEGFEILLDHVAKLEAGRNEQHDPTLQEIGVCLAATGFSQNFLSRIPFELVRISLIEWSFIRSEEEEAILIRNVRKGISFDSHPVPINRREDVSKPAPFAFPIASGELSTPELITFSRFGMELRNRREHGKSVV